MQLPSLEYIFEKSIQTLKRFPLAIASATLAAFVSVYLSELSYEQTKQADHLFNLVLVSILGIPLFTVIPLIGEKRKWQLPLSLVANGTGVLLLCLYYFLFLPNDFDQAPDLHVVRYLLYIIAVHLFVAIGPYWNKGETHGFWQYNKTLFLRFLTAGLFSAVLYIGLAVALGSIDVLFKIDIDGERYLQLFFLTAGIFNTWFFLAGIPASIDNLEYVKDYPKGLKVFTQNVLISLVIIYLVILYLYTGKIIIEWTWPEGWVAYLVLSFSILGIFSLLLLHPIREKTENKWIDQFSRSYFWILIPLVILLLLAIWVRIDEYSFTVNRYFVLALGIWLAGIVVYFISGKSENIKVIPASLAVIALIISFGPWSAFSVSERSQISRLQHYLETNNILMGDSVSPASQPILFNDRKEISSIIRYLNEMHGLEGIQPWFDRDLANLSEHVPETDTTRMINRYQKPEFIISNLLGIKYVNEWEDSASTRFSQFTSTEHEILSLDGYEWLFPFQYYKGGTATKEVLLDDISLKLNTKPDQAALELYPENNPIDTLRIQLEPLIIALSHKYDIGTTFDIPPEEMTLEASNNHLDAKIYISTLNIDNYERLTNIKGRILLRIKSK